MQDYDVTNHRLRNNTLVKIPSKSLNQSKYREEIFDFTVLKNSGPVQKAAQLSFTLLIKININHEIYHFHN